MKRAIFFIMLYFSVILDVIIGVQTLMSTENNIRGNMITFMLFLGITLLLILVWLYKNRKNTDNI